MRPEAGLKKLTAHAAELIRGCKKMAFDGTVLFTPDAVGNYDALWLRDFGYMVMYCADLMDPEEVRGCIDYAIRGRREDGWMPDRVEAGGDAVYAAGAKGSPVGRANLDNTPFLVFAAAAYTGLVSPEKAVACFSRWTEPLERGMEILPLSSEGLIWNDPKDPHSPYGFTDTVCKTGRLFMESVLYWQACRNLEKLHCRFGSTERAVIWADRAQRTENAIPMLFDSVEGVFMAADVDCRQTDVWGMLYALDVELPLPEEVRAAVEQWLLDNRERYLYRGQVCQLPDGGAWEKLLIEVPHGEYQNGAYWATASGWAIRLFRRRDPVFLEAMLDSLLSDFETEGICECVNEGYRKLPQFVVSATNARGGLL